MSWPSVLRRAVGRDGLPLLLLVSALLHLSVIGLALPGGAAMAWINDQNGASAPRLSATVSRAVALAAPTPQRRPWVSAAAPRPEREPRSLLPAPNAEPLAETAAETAAESVPAAAPSWPSAPAFYAAHELTIKPVALGEPALDGVDAVAGEIVLALWIDDRGTVVELSIERSELSAEHLPAVAGAFRSLRFSPGEVDGQAVGAVIRIAVVFADERLPLAL